MEEAPTSLPMILDRLAALIGNLLPLAGVWLWGWDVFEILVLFWMQTVLVITFAVPLIAKLPRSALGEITVNGVKRPATHRDLMLGVGLVGLVFCGGHLLFLWVIFSGHWSSIIHGPVGFVQHLVIANGAWTALAVSIVAGTISYLLTPPRAALIDGVAARIGIRRQRKNGADFGTILLRLIKRVVLMQTAIIFGGMLANSYGSMAPLLILIGLKTLVELGGTKPNRAVPTVEIKT
jgi:hypothetical protein